MKFTKEQLEYIKEHLEDNDVDLSKGFYWQFIPTDAYDSDMVLVVMSPKDFDRELNDGGIYDQHTNADIFLTDEDLDASSIGEAAESTYEVAISKEDFTEMMKKYGDFFEYSNDLIMN